MSIINTILFSHFSCIHSLITPNFPVCFTTCSVNQCKRQTRSTYRFNCTFPLPEMLSLPPPKVLPSSCFQQCSFAFFPSFQRLRLPTQLCHGCFDLTQSKPCSTWQQQMICPSSHFDASWHQRPGVAWVFFLNQIQVFYQILAFHTRESINWPSN